MDLSGNMLLTNDQLVPQNMDDDTVDGIDRPKVKQGDKKRKGENIDLLYDGDLPVQMYSEEYKDCNENR